MEHNCDFKTKKKKEKNKNKTKKSMLLEIILPQ